MTLKKFGDSKHVRRDVVGQGFLKFSKGIVSGEDGAGSNSPVARGGHVVFHISDEKSLFGAQMVVLENPMDGVPLVRHPGVGLPEKVIHAQAPGLILKVRLVDGA